MRESSVHAILRIGARPAWLTDVMGVHIERADVVRSRKGVCVVVGRRQLLAVYLDAVHRAGADSSVNARLVQAHRV